MSYIAQPREFADCIEFSPEAIEVSAPARHTSLLQRLGDALSRWEHRATDREMAAILARSGGQITDGVEREMMGQLMRRT